MPKPPDGLHVTIFHTNDMHGRLEAMLRLSSFARRMRAASAAEGRTVFFWDGGDAADRRVRICSATKGQTFASILSAMGYELQVMGNDLSLPYGPQAMTAYAARASFPVLAANFRDGTGPIVAGMQAKAIFALPGGLRLGVIGLTAPWGHVYEMFGLHLPEAAPLASALVQELQAEGVQVIAVLSHLGLDEDRRLAREVPGIHFIIGAHSHSLLPTGEVENGVLIAQAGQYAEGLGRVDLTLDPQTGRILEFAAQVLPVPEAEPADPAGLAAVEAAEAEVEQLLARPVGVLAAELDLDYFSECGMGNFAADALRERMGGEIAVICSGQFHQGLPAGQITVGQLVEACFSSANPGVTEIRGEQLLEGLERGLDPEVSENQPGGFRGTPFGIPQISGMQVVLSSDQSAAPRIRQVLVQGEPLEPERLYRMAHTDAEMMAAGYFRLDESQQPTYEVPTIVNEVLQDYLRPHSPLSLPESGRWRLGKDPR